MGDGSTIKKERFDGTEVEVLDAIGEAREDHGAHTGVGGLVAVVGGRDGSAHGQGGERQLLRQS